MTVSPDFKLITSEKELERMLKDLDAKNVVLAGLTDDLHQFLFTVRAVRGMRIVMEAISPSGRALKAEEPIQIIFGLGDGQYLIRTVIDDVYQKAASFTISKEVYRLQRRNNFRTAVPPKQNVEFQILSYRKLPVGENQVAPVVDLSAGGAKLKWPNAIPNPERDGIVKGVLTLPSGKELDLEAEIRYVTTQPSGSDVGVEFLNLSVRDEQALLFVCMQFQRDQLKFVDK